MRDGVWLVMVCCLVLVVIGECNLPPKGGEDRRSDKSVLRVGTFNLDWLFVKQRREAPWKTEQQRLEHISTVAEQILRTEVDVLAVHEVEGCDALQLLTQALGTAYRYYMIPGKDTATGQNSALVTKIDPIGPLTRTEEAFSTCTPPKNTGVAKHGFAIIQAANFSFSFVFAHFRAVGKDASCTREGQAKVIRAALDKNYRGKSTILVGDFNDRDESFVDALGHRGSSETLRILKGKTLWNPGARLSQQDRISHPAMGLIDHVLLSSDLTNRIKSVSCDGTGYPTTKEERERFFYSDHLPVVVTLTDASSAATVPPEVAAEIAVLCVVIAGLVVAIIYALWKWNGRSAVVSESVVELTTVSTEEEASIQHEASIDEERTSVAEGTVVVPPPSQ